MADKKSPKKSLQKIAAVSKEQFAEINSSMKPEVDSLGIEDRNNLFTKIFVALCSNPQSSNDTEILVGQAQALTLGALEGMAKEQF